MRIAVLSDIHANIRALDTILAALGSVDAVWHLGDVVGYGPDPDAVVDRLRERGAIGVRGNHDLAATGDAAIDDFNVDARAAMEWTRRVITPATRDWLAALPARLSVGSYSLVHGSLRDPTWEYIVSDDVATANLALLGTPYGLFGHTHQPFAYVTDTADARGPLDSGLPRPGATLVLAGRRALINPGSVGQPRDGDPRASALILDSTSDAVTWIRADYDIEGTQRAMRAVKLPARGIARLGFGA